MRIQKPQKRLYYSIREVCEMLGIPASQLKSWEKRFPEIQPLRNRAGIRQFVDRDIELLFYLKRLKNEEKLPDEEVHRKLQLFKQQKVDNHQEKLRKALAEVRVELKEILKLFE